MPDDSSRPEVGIGDIVDVPAGVDDVCDTAYRIRVDKIGVYGPSGPRVRWDGSVASVPRVVPWDVLTQSAITRASTDGDGAA